MTQLSKSKLTNQQKQKCKNGWWNKFTNSFNSTGNIGGNIYKPSSTDNASYYNTGTNYKNNIDYSFTTTNFGHRSNVKNYEIEIDVSENGYVVVIDPDGLKVRYIFPDMDELLDWVEQNFEKPNQGKEFIDKIDKKKNPNHTWATY